MRISMKYLLLIVVSVFLLEGCVSNTIFTANPEDTHESLGVPPSTKIKVISEEELAEKRAELKKRRQLFFDVFNGIPQSTTNAHGVHVTYIPIPKNGRPYVGGGGRCRNFCFIKSGRAWISSQPEMKRMCVSNDQRDIGIQLLLNDPHRYSRCSRYAGYRSY